MSESNLAKRLRETVQESVVKNTQHIYSLCIEAAKSQARLGNTTVHVQFDKNVRFSHEELKRRLELQGFKGISIYMGNNSFSKGHGSISFSF